MEVRSPDVVPERRVRAHGLGPLVDGRCSIAGCWVAGAFGMGRAVEGMAGRRSVVLAVGTWP